MESDVLIRYGGMALLVGFGVAGTLVFWDLFEDAFPHRFQRRRVAIRMGVLIAVVLIFFEAQERGSSAWPLYLGCALAWLVAEWLVDRVGW